MIKPLDNQPPDAEVADLFARHIDQRLDEAGRARLEQRIQEEPAVREYCARQLRFEADLHESLHPQKMEWLETRRLVVSHEGPEPEWEVQRTQTVRYGKPETLRAGDAPSIPARRRWFPWFLVLMGLVSLAIALWLTGRAYKKSGAPALATAPTLSPLVLRNPGFEVTDLALTPRGTSQALIDWQDYFPTSGSELCEIARVSNGTIFAKSGRNVAQMKFGAYLTQRLRRQDGNPLLAKPGLRITVSGWAYVQGAEPYILRGALRFIASGRPDEIQYEPAAVDIQFQGGGWQSFRMDLAVGPDLIRSPYNPPSAPKIDLTGRELSLSLDSRCGGVLLLDDLKIEESPSH